MATSNSDYHVASQGAGVTHAKRANDRPVALPRELPGIVIFIHGVNDPGAVYSVVEQGLCLGLNDRLSRNDLKPGNYGERYSQLKAKQDTKKRQDDVLSDPDTYLYKRTTDDSTNSVFLPFYWGYRASNNEIAKSNNPGQVTSRTADASGNLTTRGQYQDIHGNRLDAHFAKAGGFFDNATNNIPQMYDKGFETDWVTRRVMHNALAGNDVYAGDSPDRRYFVLAATRLANLIQTIRTIQPTALAEAHGMDPQHETITVLGHSQGTILTLLAQAILKQQGQRCVDCIIMVDTPYGLYATDDDSNQTGHARLKTLIDIVNAVTSNPYTIPELAELMIDSDKSGGRAGSNWSKAQGKRLDKTGKNWITFDERDNRGKVYLYFCPEDTVVGLKKVHGIGTFGVPDEVPADGAASKGKASTMPAMTALAPKRFFQRMWTRMERDHNGDGKYKKLLVGTAPARVPVRDQFERLSPGPDAGASMIGTAVGMSTNVALQASFQRNDIRFINGEELKPPCEPDLYGGEVTKGGPRPGHADVAGMVAPDDVTKNVILGNQYGSVQWVDAGTSLNPGANTQSYKDAFNQGKAPDDQSQNWRTMPRTLLPGVTIQREETPSEARKRMETDKSDQSANNYHSAVLHSPENHRWVTSMDVAIGQAVTLDDPTWRKLLIMLADWRLDGVAMSKIQSNDNYKNRLNNDAKDFINACADYYQSGKFPERYVSKAPPPLVTSELTSKAAAAQQAAVDAQQAQELAAEQRYWQDQAAKNWGNL